MKKLLLVALATFSFSALAVNIKIKTPKLSGTIYTNDIRITDDQIFLSCHFIRKKDGASLFRKRMVHAWGQHAGQQNSQYIYKINAKKGSLTEWLPGFDLVSCGVKLILIGKNIRTDQTVLGDLMLLGVERGAIDPREMAILKDPAQTAKYLHKRLEQMEIANEGSRIFEVN